MSLRTNKPAEGLPNANIIRTLLVDDSPVMLRTLARILTQEGKFTLVGAATDGCQALRHVLASSPELVLMDLHLPYLNGIEATRYIKQFENPPAIIIITSDDSPNSRSMAKNAGADAFVVKAGDLRVQLRARLQELFGSHHEGGKSSTGICSASCLAPGCSI